LRFWCKMLWLLAARACIFDGFNDKFLDYGTLEVRTLLWDANQGWCLQSRRNSSLIFYPVFFTKRLLSPSNVSHNCFCCQSQLSPLFTYM
jgi:hypothetical protein